VVGEIASNTLKCFKEGIESLGFELIDDKKSKLIEKVKTEVINLIHKPRVNLKTNFSLIIFPPLDGCKALRYGKARARSSTVHTQQEAPSILFQRQFHKIFLHELASWEEILGGGLPRLPLVSRLSREDLWWRPIKIHLPALRNSIMAGLLDLTIRIMLENSD
jgi:hypothetical protein